MSRYGPKPRPAIDRFMSKVEKHESGCWIWVAACFKHGYGQFGIDADRRSYYAHRFSYEHFNGNIPDGMQVLHKCDVRNCVNPEHLFLGTQKDNIDDMDAKGRRVNSPKHRESHHKSVLTEQSIKEILVSNLTNVALAQKYGVQPSAISKVRNGRTWKQNATQPINSRSN